MEGNDLDKCLLVSGSRYLSAHIPLINPVFAAFVNQVAGDAPGLDTSIIHAATVPLRVFVTAKYGSRVKQLPAHAEVVVVPSVMGEKSPFLTRDEQMARYTARAPKNGFIGLWNGYSRGTILTAEWAKKLGIPGILYRAINMEAYRVEQRWGEGQ